MNLEEEPKKDYSKIIYLFFILACVLVFMLVTLKDFEKESRYDIQTVIGNEIGGNVSLTLREHVAVRAIEETYFNAIRSGNFSKAYGYTSPPYRNYVTEEEFISKIQEIGIENFEYFNRFDLKQIAENMIVSDITLADGTVLEQLIIIEDESTFYVVPEPFLEYRKYDREIKKKGITYTLNGCRIDLEQCTFDMTIKNETKNPLEIANAELIYLLGATKKAENSTLTVPAGETVNVGFKVRTFLEFPSDFSIQVEDGNNLRKFMFDLRDFS